MAVNRVIIQGRIPFEIDVYNAGDDKKMVARFVVSVKRSYKPEGEQYYPEDLIPCVAFGSNAKFIHTYFNNRDKNRIIVEGELRVGDDYSKDDGSTVKGTPYLHVTKTDFQEGNAAGAEGGTAAPKKEANARKTPTTGRTTPKGNNPFARK